MAEFISFDTLDLGSSKPISVPEDKIIVKISDDNLVSGYGKSFVQEAARVNPLKFEQVGLTSEEVESYCNYLLTQRIKCVNSVCSEWNRLKILYIPAWVQYSMRMIGEVRIRNKGLLLIPEMETPSKMTLNEAIQISEKIGAFEDDLQIVQDAMPRDRAGNVDVMSTAILAGYVRSLEEVDHVSATYVSAFLGMKLKEEAAFQVLYRSQYDDIAYITSALSAKRII